MARLATWTLALLSLCWSGVAEAQVDDPDSLLFYSNGTGSSFQWSFAESGWWWDDEPDGDDNAGVGTWAEGAAATSGRRVAGSSRVRTVPSRTSAT